MPLSIGVNIRVNIDEPKQIRGVEFFLFVRGKNMALIKTFLEARDMG